MQDFIQAFDVLAPIVAGLFVLCCRRGVLHYGLWAAILGPWLIGAVVQDITGQTRIPAYNAGLSLLTGSAAVLFALRYRVLWPLWISGIMGVSVAINLFYFIYLSAGGGAWLDVLQRLPFLLYYLALSTLYHRIRLAYDTRENFVYS